MSGIEGRMCKSWILSGDRYSRQHLNLIHGQTIQSAIGLRDRTRGCLSATKDVVHSFTASVLQINRTDFVGRVAMKNRNATSENITSCFWVVREWYAVGIWNKLSGDPVVCSFIMISTRLSTTSYPFFSAFLCSPFRRTQYVFVFPSLVPLHSPFRFDLTPPRYSFSPDFSHFLASLFISPVYIPSSLCIETIGNTRTSATISHAFCRVNARVSTNGVKMVSLLTPKYNRNTRGLLSVSCLTRVRKPSLFFASFLRSSRDLSKLAETEREASTRRVAITVLFCRFRVWSLENRLWFAASGIVENFNEPRRQIVSSNWSSVRIAYSR